MLNFFGLIKIMLNDMKYFNFSFLLLSMFLTAVKVNAAMCEENETCVALADCPSALDSRLQNQTYQLAPIQCGVYSESHRVCCLNDSLKDSTVLKKFAPELIIEVTSEAKTVPVDIKSHKNIELINDQSSCGRSDKTKIAGGVVADLHQFPWLALLQFISKDNESSFKCIGSLVSKRYVLTSSHCVNQYDDFVLSSVRLGEHTLSKSPDCTVYEDDDTSSCTKFLPEDFLIESIISHENYSASTNVNDIALIRLSRDVQLSKKRYHIRPICLPVDDAQQIENLDDNYHTLMVAGWGTSNESMIPISDELKYTYVPYLPKDLCEGLMIEGQNKFQVLESNQDNKICIGSSGDATTCLGDRGAPLMGHAELNEMPRIFQHGIVSGGQQCNKAELLPALNTNVNKYISWILDNMTA